MTCTPIDSNDDASVLDSPVWIKELRAHGADIGLACKGQQAFEPQRLQDFGVVVEKHQKWPARFCRGLVAETRIVKGPGQDAAVLVLLELCKIGFALLYSAFWGQALSGFRAACRFDVPRGSALLFGMSR
jgi:hypothetical protein